MVTYKFVGTFLEQSLNFTDFNIYIRECYVASIIITFMAISNITFLTFHQQTMLACDAVNAFLQVVNRRNPQAKIVLPLLNNVICHTVCFIFIFIFSLILEMLRCTKELYLGCLQIL